MAEGENELPQIVLWPPHMCHDTHTHTKHTQMKGKSKVITLKGNFSWQITVISDIYY